MPKNTEDSPGATTQEDVLYALLHETWTTTTAEDILLAAFDSPRIEDSAVHAARERVMEAYDE